MDTTAEAKVAAEGQIDRSLTDWYKDAIIYQLHVKAFSGCRRRRHRRLRRADPTARLSSRASASTPCGCCRSIHRRCSDDGYDIADYHSINHDLWRHGASSRRFIAEAHRRGMRVITELVINHTSDQHPWFQRARVAPARIERARLLCLERHRHSATAAPASSSSIPRSSNWTWDPVAKAYYWHRFYSHQPDLNFDNPPCVRGGDQGAAASGSTWASTGSGSMPCPIYRARRHQQRESARDA